MIDWDFLEKQLDGELFIDELTLRLYATDASAYREVPMAVCFPKNQSDLSHIFKFANAHQIPIIPRAAGTSLAGQVVGKGLIVDISKHFNKILDYQSHENTIWIEPGIIRDDLNKSLAKDGLFYSPETSTSNRCMIGGMVGNNSCGSRSLVYGSAREHLLEAKGFLADGSAIHARDLNVKEYHEKLSLNNLEGDIYRSINEILSKKENREAIQTNFPNPKIPRRNTGYALDLLMATEPFGGKIPFNLCKLLAGSEGTIAFLTELKLNLTDLPPKHQGLICLQFDDLYECLLANKECLAFKPQACELIDHYILDCTLTHPTYSKYGFFIEGKPKAVLVVEIAENTEELLEKKHAEIKSHLQSLGLGYAYPMLRGDDSKKVWELRKAGLGLLSNVPGDAKPVAVIEDTAVLAEDLPEYIREFNLTLKKYDLHCVHYAHAATGELHLRPILDLKKPEDRKLFRIVADEIAKLVKKYKGSLSGEHGDGRLRGEFIEFMIGSQCYDFLKSFKNCADPKGLLNPGKIIDSPAMDSYLRYEENQVVPEFKTAFDFSSTQGFVRAAEMCNGSADCKKTELSGGTMCPSFMVTRDEKHSTRARANVLREYIGREEGKVKFDRPEIKEAMDLCLSCKGCKSECPSNVDIAKLKSEYEYQTKLEGSKSFQDKQFAKFSQNYKLASKIPSLFNGLSQSNLVKSILGVHPKRSIPKVAKVTFKNSFKNAISPEEADVFLFVDEFTNLLEPELAFDSIKLLNKLGEKTYVLDIWDSARSLISKGFLNEAKSIVSKNLNYLKDLPNKPIIGLEPSAILGFRDEFPDLCPEGLKNLALEISQRSFLMEEFIANGVDSGKYQTKQFKSKNSKAFLHGHCHQKALSEMSAPKKMLSLIDGLEVRLIPSGCCGMAGSFGYTKDHFEVSQKIGELVLFPTIRSSNPGDIILASGTSCRHQILEACAKDAIHPIQFLASLI